MSILTELRAALERKREAYQAISAPPTVDFEEGIAYERLRRRRAYEGAQWALEEALTDDTIRALLNVAEAADELCQGGTFPRLQAALAPLVKEADHDRA